jgi:type III pantothenate kinase
MILAVDIGNSNIACGIFDGEELVTRFRLRTSILTTPDEYEASFLSILHAKRIDPGLISGIGVASVVPDLNDGFRTFLPNLFRREPVFISTTEESGLKITIDNPRELGVDLLCNAAAAYRRYRSDCIVVDFGTALTFSMVSYDRRFLGVAIAPGIKSGMEALFANTAQLPHIDLQPPSRAIGVNTVQSLQSGIVFGYAGLVDSMIRRIKAEMTEPVVVVSTGGYSRTVTGQIELIDHLVPDLTLEGINSLYRMQARSELSGPEGHIV